MKTATQVQVDGPGSVLWWDFTDVKIRVSDAESAIRALGLESEVEIPDRSTESRVRKAATRFRYADNLGGRWRAEVVGVYDNATSFEVALLRHERLSDDRAADEKVQWAHRATVLYDEPTDAWTRTVSPEADGSDVAEVFLLRAADRLSFLDAEWFRDNVLQGPLDRIGAFPLRRRVGVFFFVPAAVQPEIDRYVGLAHDLVPGCVSALQVAATDGGLGAIGASARDHLGARVEELRERIETWRSSLCSPHQALTAKTMEEFREIRSLASLYGDTLQVQLDDLVDAADAMSDEMLQIVGLAEKGAPSGLVELFREILASRDLAQPIPFADLATAGLPNSAVGPRARAWWRKRGSAAAVALGYATEVCDDGVRFEAAGAVPA